MQIRITNFGGTVPRLGDKNLPDMNAQVSVNTKLYSGELRAWNRGRAVAVTPIKNPRTVYRYDHRGAMRVIAFAEDTWVVKAPLLRETLGRLYWAGAGGVKVNTMARIDSGAPAFSLGVPAPEFTGVSVAVTGGTSITSVTRAYICALVTAFGEEGPVSDVFTASGPSDGTWAVTALNTLQYDAVKWGNVRTLRLYRTVTSDTGVDYRLVTEWDVGSLPATYEDTVPDTAAATAPAYEAFEWGPPPDDLTGIISVAGGFLAGFRGREVWFTPPYRPHAWPESYKLATEDDIVALGTFGNTVVITTKGEPYAATGSVPEVMTLTKYDKVLPCVSAKGLVATSGAVLYPSIDGLVSISAAGYDIISLPYVTKDEWLVRFSPRGIRAAAYQNRYLAFYNSRFGFSIGFDDPTTGFTDIELDGVSSVDLDRTTGQTLVTIGDRVLEWDDDRGGRLTYRWRSKPFLVPKPANFAALQLRGEFTTNIAGWGEFPEPLVDVLGHRVNDYPLNGRVGVSVVPGRRSPVGFPINGPGTPGTGNVADTGVLVRVWCDNLLQWEGIVNSQRPYRLPSQRKGPRWEIELTGKVPIYSATISTTAIGLEATP